MVSLWQTLSTSSSFDIIDNLKQMAFAWNAGDYKTWNELSMVVRDDLQSQNETSWTLSLEHYYVTINPMVWVMVLYMFGATAAAYSKTSLLSLPLISLGFLIHVIALLTRSLILSRPPTGTLYETLLFGAAIVMLVGLCSRKNQLFLVTCALSAAFLLFVSRGFIQGDSLNVLVAVLNTNFWLSTHVTCIIIGYAFCVMAAMVGHVYLYSNAIKIEKLMVPLTLAALLFTSIGTLLGGIWADQSWGRFWGWDPKENGALLIVLWLAWILHGRISGHFQKQGFAAALGLTNIMVALTWFGVNLPCVVEFPELIALANKRDDITILAFSSDRNQPMIDRFLGQNKFNIPDNFKVIHDEKQKITRDKFSVFALPESFIVAPDMILDDHIIGAYTGWKNL